MWLFIAYFAVFIDKPSMLDTVRPFIVKKAIKIVKTIPIVQLKKLEKNFENFSNLTLLEILPTMLNTTQKINMGIKMLVKILVIIVVNDARTGWKVDAVTVPPIEVIKVSNTGKTTSV